MKKSPRYYKTKTVSVVLPKNLHVEHTCGSIMAGYNYKEDGETYFMDIKLPNPVKRIFWDAYDAGLRAGRNRQKHEIQEALGIRDGGSCL